MWVARAPGRLDVLGGVADYSGGRVVEMTLACGTRVGAAATDDDVIRVRTTEGPDGASAEVTLPAAEVFAPPEVLGARLRDDPATTWVGYAAGPVAILAEHAGLAPRGLCIEIESDVPMGAGVSSSAALEVAALMAVMRALEVEVVDDDVPLLAQAAEHRVVGAPCGLMDQVAVYHGDAGRLLPLVCRPMTVEPAVPIPPDLRLVGIVSGVRHRVGGAAYARARTAAFMGRTLLGANAAPWLAAYDAPDADGCLAALPESLRGDEFLAVHDDHGDPRTRVDPALEYPVRAATAYPITQSANTSTFLAALARNDVITAGAMLGEAHATYGDLGLGCGETDLLAAEVARLGPERGLFGARISGGGSGGTVVVLAATGASVDAALAEVGARYRAATGITPMLLEGSSRGARHAGVHHT
ncbi:MAG: hypothetical protein CMJ83_05375 [Planctomycetes bacterium]|nr:hypothetical protein [Planctomycetota bacterium]